VIGLVDHSAAALGVKGVHMAIEVAKVTDVQVMAMLSLEESHFCDLKAIDIRPAKLTVAASAFANADGGELYIGVDEDTKLRQRTWRGFVNQEAANAHIQVLEALFPLGRDFQYAFLTCDGRPGLILKVEVKKTREIRRASDRTPYIRRGAQNLPVVTPEATKQLEYVKGLTSFETEVVDVPADTITNSTPIIAFMLEVIPTNEPAAWLAKQLLLREGRPTVAGILLFAEEPQALLPKHCGVKIYRYRTKDREGTRDTLAFDPITVEGHAYDQVRKAVDMATSVVEETGRLGESGIEAVRYPKETLHEIITNAVLHRDYSIADDIHIRVFDNRIEVQSPGRLPAHVTPENILDERFARNGTLVRLINKFPNPPNKDVGEGLNTAFAAMHRMGLKEPAIQNLENSVLVTIRHESLASPETIILQYLENHATIKNKEARELCHIQGDYIVKEIFRKLVERQLIERVPGKRTAAIVYRQGPKFGEWK
jgi:ATP-dependent DNA helicase RecG